MTMRGRYQKADLIRSADLPTARGTCVHLPPLLASDDALARWQARVDDDRTIIVLDLFSGCGGMTLGFENAGLFVAAALDSDPFACETHAANFLSKSLRLDLRTANPREVIRDLGLPRVDIIIGGPPCQGFSLVGRARVRSLTDEQRQEVLARNTLYRQYLRFVDELRPLMFVMENVPHFKTFDRGAIFESVRAESQRLGYVIDDKMLVATDFGVPQARRRLFIVGTRIGRNISWPRPSHRLAPITLRDAIGDLPAVTAPQLEECLPYHPGQASSYADLMRRAVPTSDQDRIYDHVVRPVREDDRVIFQRMRPGSRYVDIDPRYQRYDVRSFEDRYLMLDPDRPSNTITAHLAKDGYRHIHWDTDQCRTLSVREVARIQSFGDHFRFTGFRTGRFRQIGNAVPPHLAEAIARQIRRALLGEPDAAADTDGAWQPGLPGLVHQERQERQDEPVALAANSAD